jgi:hypothetical protein
MIATELLQDVGLAHLPGSLEDERLVVWPVFPFCQLLGQFSFHCISQLVFRGKYNQNL